MVSLQLTEDMTGRRGHDADWRGSLTCPGVTRSASIHMPCTHRPWPEPRQSSKRTVQSEPDHSGEQLQLWTERERVWVCPIKRVLH